MAVAACANADMLSGSETQTLHAYSTCSSHAYTVQDVAIGEVMIQAKHFAAVSAVLVCPGFQKQFWSTP
jgi:hypothetical protein